MLVTMLALACSGCTTLQAPSTPPEATLSTGNDPCFNVVAQFSITAMAQQQRNSGVLSWQHCPLQATLDPIDQMTISSPLGLTVAEIVRLPTLTRITSANGETITIADLDDYLRQQNMPLPTQRFPAWLLMTQANYRAQLIPPTSIGAADACGRPLTVQDADWQISYSYPQECPAPPARLDIKNEPLQLQAVFRLNSLSFFTPKVHGDAR